MGVQPQHPRAGHEEAAGCGGLEEPLCPLTALIAGGMGLLHDHSSLASQVAAQSATCVGCCCPWADGQAGTHECCTWCCRRDAAASQSRVIPFSTIILAASELDEESHDFCGYVNCAESELILPTQCSLASQEEFSRSPPTQMGFVPQSFQRGSTKTKYPRLHQRFQLHLRLRACVTAAPGLSLRGSLPLAIVARILNGRKLLSQSDS